MSISGVGNRSNLLVSSLGDMRARLDDLQRQLGTGDKSTTYAGLGADRGLAVSLRNQLNLMTGYADAVKNVGVRINLAQSALGDIANVGSIVKSAANTSTFTIDNTGQTVSQRSAVAQLDQVLTLLNTQAGDRYLFSGRATNQPATQALDQILNGDVTHAGFKQVLSERQQADLGANGLGRLAFPAATTTPASLTGTGATIAADASATVTGTQNLGGAYTSGGGTLTINGINVAISAGDNIAAILAKINAPGVVAQTGVNATAPGGLLTLTSANAINGVNLTGTTGSLITEFGTAVGPTQPTNLLTQVPAPVTAGQTLTVAVGSNPPLTITFGTNQAAVPPEVATLAQLNAALGTLAGGTASAGANGNITITASNPNDAILVGGTANSAKFGLTTNIAVPSMAPASLTGTGATITADVNAVATGSQNLGGAYTSAGGTLTINGVSVAISAGDNVAAILAKINAPGVVALTGVNATAPGGLLTLTGANASIAVDLTGTTGSLITEFGIPVGPTQPNNLLTQIPAPVTAGQTLTVTVGTNPPLTITFGTNQAAVPPQVSTLAQLNAALGTLSATASVGASGNITITANNTTDAITVGGSANPAKFGLTATSAMPSNVVGLSEESPVTVFGFKLANISTTSAGIAVTGPTSPAPALVTMDFHAQPLANDQVKLAFNLPDGSSENIVLTATTANPPAPGQFTIGASLAATTANFQAALNTSVSKLAATSLTAASAIAASNNFFNVGAGQPPMRVAGPPFTSATALTAGTTANTVTWYTGEMGTDPARGTAVATVDNSLTVSYGARGNEQALTDTIKNIAVYASMTYSASDPNAQARYYAVNQRVGANLAGTNGQQQISDIEAELAFAQSTMTTAQQSEAQRSVTLTNFLQGIEQASPDEVSSQILALQTQLQASLQTTAMLYKLSIVNYIS